MRLIVRYASALFAMLILGSLACANQERGKHTDVSYVVIAPAISEETPVVERQLATAPGQDPFLRNDSVYAAANDLLRVLRPGARVRLTQGNIFVDDRSLAVPGIELGGVLYVPVKAFARQFGAYTRINGVDGSATIWPHDALMYWREHGDPRAPVLSDAAAESIIPPPRSSKPSDH